MNAQTIILTLLGIAILLTITWRALKPWRNLIPLLFISDGFLLGALAGVAVQVARAPSTTSFVLLCAGIILWGWSLLASVQQMLAKRKPETVQVADVPNPSWPDEPWRLL